MSRHAVAHGYQVNHDGTVYGPGDVLPDNVDDNRIDEWTRAGYIAPAQAAKPAARSSAQ